jgi:hypothetical protein
MCSDFLFWKDHPIGCQSVPVITTIDYTFSHIFPTFTQRRRAHNILTERGDGCTARSSEDRSVVGLRV